MTPVGSHGYCHYCYLPLYLTCGEHGCAVCAAPTATRATGQELTAVWRRFWPDTKILVRDGILSGTDDLV